MYSCQSGEIFWPLAFSCPLINCLWDGFSAFGKTFGILSAFFKLQLLHEVVTFSQEVIPPLLLGIRWSLVNSFYSNTSLQYWQVNISLKKTLDLENLTFFENLWNFLSITMLGTLNEVEGDLTIQSSCSLIIITFLVITNLTAVFQSTEESGK